MDTQCEARESDNYKVHNCLQQTFCIHRWPTVIERPCATEKTWICVLKCCFKSHQVKFNATITVSDQNQQLSIQLVKSQRLSNSRQKSCEVTRKFLKQFTAIAIIVLPFIIIRLYCYYMLYVFLFIFKEKNKQKPCIASHHEIWPWGLIKLFSISLVRFNEGNFNTGSNDFLLFHIGN